MTNPFVIKSLKSPIIIGLFCWLCWLSGCRKQTDPGDVTIMFWVALSENNWKAAKKYSLEGSEALFDQKSRNIYLQIGKVDINYDHAVVETYVTRDASIKSNCFNTYLTRTKKTDQWRVDFLRTQAERKNKNLKNLKKMVVKLGSETKNTLIDQSKSLLQRVKDWFKK